MTKIDEKYHHTIILSFPILKIKNFEKNVLPTTVMIHYVIIM